MSAATISFFLSAAISTVAALVGVTARQPARTLAGFAVALAGLLVPLIQLRAPAVAAVLLLATGVVIGLLAGLCGLERGEQARRLAPTPVFWVFAGTGLLGFGWVLLATGSRQVVEGLPDLDPGARFGQGSALLLELAGTHTVAGLIVGLLALCSVIAAVLTLVGEADRPSSKPGGAA